MKERLLRFYREVDAAWSLSARKMRGHNTRFRLTPSIIGQNLIPACLVSEYTAYPDSVLRIAFPRR